MFYEITAVQVQRNLCSDITSADFLWLVYVCILRVLLSAKSQSPGHQTAAPNFEEDVNRRDIMAEADGAGSRTPSQDLCAGLYRRFEKDW